MTHSIMTWLCGVIVGMAILNLTPPKIIQIAVDLKWSRWTQLTVQTTACHYKQIPIAFCTCKKMCSLDFYFGNTNPARHTCIQGLLLVHRTQLGLNMYVSINGISFAVCEQQSPSLHRTVESRLDESTRNCELIF